MPPKSYNLRNREPSNGDDVHVEVSTDTQTGDSERSEMNTIHSLILLLQEVVASLLSFGNGLLTDYTDFDDISSVTSELPVAEAELVRLTKSLALHISTSDFAHHANKLTSITLGIRCFKESVARSKRSACGGSNSNDPPAPAAATSDLPHDIPSSSSSRHPLGHNSSTVPPLTNAVSFSPTTFGPICHCQTIFKIILSVLRYRLTHVLMLMLLIQRLSARPTPFMTIQILCHRNLMARRRFVALRGNPLQFYSDNATTFIKASKGLKKCIGESSTGQFLSRRLVTTPFGLALYPAIIASLWWFLGEFGKGVQECLLSCNWFSNFDS